MLENSPRSGQVDGCPMINDEEGGRGLDVEYVSPPLSSMPHLRPAYLRFRAVYTC